MRLSSVFAIGLVLALSAPCRADLFFSRQTTTTSGEVIRYDTLTRSVVQTFPVPIGDMDGLALDPTSGHLFIATSTGNGLFRLDLASGALNPVSIPITPFGPADMSFGPTGHLFILNQTSPGAVIRFNVASSSVESTLTVGPTSVPRGLAIGANGDFFISSGSNVFQIDPVTGAVLRAYGGFAIPYGVALGTSGDLFVANFSTSNVVQLDLTTGAVLRTYAGLSSPTGLAIGPDGNLYVASGTDVVVLNTATGAVLDRIPVGQGGAEYLTFGTVGTVVPEPSSLAALGVGCVGLLLARRLRRRPNPCGT